MGIELPSDIICLILGHLRVQDILNVRQASKEFLELTKLRSVWESLLHSHVLHQNIPLPGLSGRSYNELTTTEMETCLRRALKLRRNWISESPLISNQFTLAGIPDSRIVSLQVLPGHGHRRLLSLSFEQSRVFTLQCWDIAASPPICIARRAFRRLGGMAVNVSLAGVGVLAVLTPNFNIEILSLDLEAVDPDHAFVTSLTIDEPAKNVLHFANSILLIRDNNEGLCLLDVHNPQAEVELRNENPPPPAHFLDAIITPAFVLLLRMTTLELYALPPTMPFTTTTLYPIVVFQWPWRIDNAGMTQRHPPPGYQGKSAISVFIRFSSYFPWAINILHHYEIRPNAYFSNASPISATNLPYEFPPVLRETIGSPVRLHATSDLAIGPYGTAVWIDSHTEDYFFHADRGQRLAGMLAPSPYFGTEEDEEVELSDQIATAAATSVYAYHEEDSWVKVALDEEEGRIFLGHDDGLIMILEYV
ncbi:hypothetical protein M413DRAFT_24939 [Hebeloma cylindrosporum]|uniref:F-box domain-containing protein n=1 Tax=Hebeloma cylindrosporum TaxID=76867 RepID=A0A0C2Y3L1_HEBCY|nr:hypothetical protein M413DRAFT_24939 [Hebeloma cylindrosporum h7]